MSVPEEIINTLSPKNSPIFYPTLKEILNLPLENSIDPRPGGLYYDFTRHKLVFDMF